MTIRNEADERGERLVWLEEVWVNRLGAMRGPGEDYSAVIPRLARPKTRKGRGDESA